MTRKELKNQIQASYAASYDTLHAGSQLSAIKAACNTITQEEEMPQAYTPSQGKFFTKPRVQWMVAFAVMVVLIATCVHLSNLVIRSNPGTPAGPQVHEGITEVIIDVNPSIELVLDENHLVVSCQALNDDATDILAGLTLTGSSSGMAFQTIVGALYLNGYLQGGTDAMLVSVDTEDDAELDEIRKELAEVMEDATLSLTILIQHMDKEALQSKAEEYHISEGKLELVERIIELSDAYEEDSVEVLAAKTIRELADLYQMLTAAPDTGETDADNTTEEATTDSDAESADASAETASELDQVIEDSIQDAGQIAEEAVSGAGQIVDDSLEGAGQIVDDSLTGAGQIADDSLGVAGQIVDDAFDSVGQITDTILGDQGEDVSQALDEANKEAQDAIAAANEEIQNALEEARKEAEKIFIIIH